MTDTATHKPIRVLMDEATGPYIMLTVNAVEQVRKVLLENQIAHWVDQHQVSVDGKPFVTTIWIRRGTDPQQVQALLDQVG